MRWAGYEQVGRQEIDRWAEMEMEMDRQRIRVAVKENKAVKCEDEYGLQRTKCRVQSISSSLVLSSMSRTPS